MGRKIDYDIAGHILTGLFEQAENDFHVGAPVIVPQKIVHAVDKLFETSTQAYREALIGCALIRIIDPDIDIRSPYINQAENAFSGRTLDEKVVNPFLHDRQIPCSKGPYLSALRRNIRFIPETARGLRDKEAYAAFLVFISEIERVDAEETDKYLRYLLCAFARLRETSRISLAHIKRLSLTQYETLIEGLLQVPSGGLLPVLLSVAMFVTIKQSFDLDWEIEWQGINVSDRASGAGGDITIKQDNSVILAVEITERSIDRSRVTSTFNTKISPQGIEDYLFLFSSSLPKEEALEVARHYFAQGHDINFLPVKSWLIHILGTIGPKSRKVFTNEFLALLDRPEVPATVKVAWNDLISGLL